MSEREEEGEEEWRKRGSVWAKCIFRLACLGTVVVVIWRLVLLSSGRVESGEIEGCGSVQRSCRYQLEVEKNEV